MFNRREQQALIGLAAALLLGSLAAVGDWYRPATLEEFRVIPRAVEPPPMLELVEEEQGPILLNSATAAELVALPAVGPKTAARIGRSARVVVPAPPWPSCPSPSTTRRT